MASRDSGDLIAELRELVAKSIEANSRMIQNGTELVRRASSGDKADLAKLASDGSEVLNKALREYVRLSAVHTSRLIDLGVEVSDRIAGRAGAPPGSTASGTRSLVDLRLSGVPGATCQTAFAVDNDHTAAIPVAFEYGMMVDRSGETAADVEIRFEPSQALIPPGGQGRFVLSLTIPSDMPPGVHETLVAIKGLSQLGFRVLLEVGDPWEKGAARRATSDEKAGETAAKKATGMDSGKATAKATRESVAKAPGKASKKPAAGPARTARDRPAPAQTHKKTQKTRKKTRKKARKKAATKKK